MRQDAAHYVEEQKKIIKDKNIAIRKLQIAMDKIATICYSRLQKGIDIDSEIHEITKTFNTDYQREVFNRR